MLDQSYLEVPQTVATNPNAFEILRVWVADKQQQVSLRTGVWDDPAAWGIMLADLARHVAECYRREEGRDFSATLARIKAGIDIELK